MKKPQQSVIKNEADKSAKIFLYGIIGDYWSDSPLTAKAFVRQLTTLQGQGIKRVDVHLHGPGGDVWEGLGIINAIKTSLMDIHTHNDGICASMHGTIFASAKNGNRHLAKNSVFMIHNASTIAWGNSQTMRETADFLDTHDSVLVGIFADATGKPAKEIKDSYFDYRDHWLTAEEVSALGIGEVSDQDAVEVPKDIKNMSLQQVAAIYDPNVSIQNVDMALIEINNKFKSISALAKVAAADVTAEQLKAINEELEAEGIKGITVVKDSDLQETVEAAGKVAGLEASITAKDAKITALEAQVAKIAGLEATIAEQKKKLDASAEDPNAPPVEKPDDTPGDGKDNPKKVETPQDIEMNQINALFNLIP